MKLPDDMVERAAESLCNNIGPEFDAWHWDRTEDGEQHRVQWRIDARAALEAALSECATGIAVGYLPNSMALELKVGTHQNAAIVGRHFALVPLGD